MNKTPRGLRPHIVLAGNRNCGKSSFLNRLTGKDAAIVSSTPGTTTDPVYINMELLPFGPVTFIDTPGLDDEGQLGNQRIERANRSIRSGDLLVYICRPSLFNARVKERFATSAGEQGKALLLLTFADQSDERRIADQILKEMASDSCLVHIISNVNGEGIHEVSQTLVNVLKSAEKQQSSLLEDLVRNFQLIMMIVPIDMEAPKGRLILPQVQAIREVLDSDAASLVVKDREIDWALSLLKNPPDLAITDSQVVLKAASSIPDHIPLTTFSILFSKLEGDLQHFVESVKVIDSLEHGDKVLIAETCTHKTMCDDIGRVKIPRWLRQFTGKDLDIQVTGGHFPSDMQDVRLIIHCGGCMITRKTMMTRVGEASDLNIPVTNYGIAISHLHGVLDRVLEPFSNMTLGQINTGLFSRT